jgi:REP element-mobilizing transposase RayT
MARTKRNCPAGDVFHVLNRAVARVTIFEKPEDYAAFMRVVAETWEIVRLPVYAMVAMPNHWHGSSAHARCRPGDERLWLAIPDDPPLPRNWRSWVNMVETEGELSRAKGVRSHFFVEECCYTHSMPRTKRICPAGEVFHVLNRAVARLTIFEKPEDYEAFMRVLDETWQIVPLPIFAMVAMPNHWHFVVRPETADQVSEFFRRLTVMHTMRWHAHYKTGGTGHLYQGRFKSFPIQSDNHLLTVMRYVERNPVRANLIELAEEWKWSSAYRRRRCPKSPLAGHSRRSTSAAKLAFVGEQSRDRRRAAIVAEQRQTWTPVW